MRIARYIFILISFLPFINTALAQEETDSLKQWSYFSFGMANDVLQNRTKSDKYFSNGFVSSYHSQTLDNNFMRKVLVGNENGYSIMGLIARQNGFTPDNLTMVEVDSTDRPYCGTLSLQYQRYSTNNKDWIFISGLKLGVSGPASQTERVQKAIHESTGSTPPMGWDNQIANGLILDYYVSAKKQFIQSKEHIRFETEGYAEVGTFITLAGAFGNFKTGWFNDNFKNYEGLRANDGAQRKWQLYAEFGVGARLVLYDGTSQGSLIPFEESPYTLQWNDYQHFTTQFAYKLTYSYQGFKASYTNIVESNRYFLEDVFSFGNITVTIPIPL